MELAVEAGARKLVLFHHEPEHDDGAMDALHAAARGAAQQRGATADVVVAQEGMRLSL